MQLTRKGFEYPAQIGAAFAKLKATEGKL